MEFLEIAGLQLLGRLPPFNAIAPMKVLYVIPDLSRTTGGPVTALAGLSEAQAGMGVDVSIATTGWGFLNAPSLSGVNVHAFPCVWDRWRWAPQLGGYLQHNVRHYDLVCIESLWQYPTWKAATVCRSAGVPYVISTNGMLESWSVSQKAWKKQPYLRWFEGNSLRGAAALHATSEMEYRNSSMPAWNRWAFVLPLGLPERSYTAVPDRGCFRQQFPALSGKSIVLFLGRVHYKKQPEVAIAAFAKVADQFRDAVLVFAGPGEPSYVARLKALSADLGVGERVSFTGMLEGETVAQAFSAATVFILPSLQENFGLAVAEAMAMCCPVIVSDQVQLAPAIATAGAGLVRPATVEEMGHALRAVLSDPRWRSQMGQNGRKLVLEHFTWPALARSFLDVFEDIVRDIRTSPAWRDSYATTTQEVASACDETGLQASSG